MATTAYGSITIVDIGDLGELSVTPQSNQPITVIYDPDSNSYSPTWSSSNKLKLSPVVYYGGTKLADGTMTKASGLTVTWTKQVGSGTAGAHGGSVDNTTGALTISSVPFDPSTATLITYIVTVQYTEANMGTTLEASGQITFSLVQNASKLKTVSISGASAFLYNSSNVCQNSPITLTATVKNVTVSKWQYKNGSSWTDISNSASSTLSVAESTAAYFSSDVAVFRVVTNDANVYDEHTIIKVRDGAPGDKLDSAVLSNEDQMVPCDKNGNPISYTGCDTTLTIYEGNTPATGWTITSDTTHNVGGTWTSSTNGGTFTATSLSADTGYVTFTCEKTGHNTLTKTFSLVKVKAGADGTDPIIYSLEVDALAVNKAENNTLTPSTINLSSYKQEGNGAKTAYAGIFKIYKNDSTTATYTSASAESTKAFTVPTDADKLKIELYEAGGSTLYDTQTVVIVSDGATGAQGPGGLNFVLGNYSDVIPCTNGGLVAAAQTIIIPFTVFQGTTRRACTATTSTLPSGMTKNTSSSTNGTASAAGQIVINVAANATLGSAATKTGTITITITDTDSSATSTETYTWTKNNQALNGTNAVIFQLYTPEGNVISNDINNVVIKPQLNDGVTDATAASGVTYTWYYWNGTTYAAIESGQGGYTIGTRQLTVAPAAVNSYVSIKCTCNYSSHSYDAYMSIYDKTDPLQVTVLSTLGDKLVNSVGTGILYTRVYRNGVEIDAIKTTDCGTSYPSSPTSGQYFWLLDSSNKTATLKKYSGSSWATSSDQTGTYTWSRLDGITGTALSLSNNSGKAIYLDADLVDGKSVFNVIVEI